jgi:nicotinate-nucleotide adenylyltransferase
MEVILFGGAFDPPHVGHQQMVYHILEKKLASEVWYVPCFQHPFNKSTSSLLHRLNMLKLIQNHTTKIFTYELEKGDVSYSLETLRYVEKTQLYNHFSWLVGSDQLPEFHKWKDYKILLENFPVYVYPRKNYPLSPWYPGMIAITQVPEFDISSTDIRQRLRNGSSITGLVDPRVEEYILKNELYQ